MTLQEPELSEQEEEENCPVEELDDQDTAPVGEDPVMDTVQVVEEPAATDSGEQETEADEEALTITVTGDAVVVVSGVLALSVTVAQT